MRPINCFLWTVVLLGLGAELLTAADPQVAAPGSPPKVASEEKPKKLKYEVSKATTFLTGPLRKNGEVDFTAAINEHAKAGVTRENNAAIPFWQVMGPDEIEETLRADLFKELGIDSLPVEGDYFIDFDEYLTMVVNGGAPGKELLTDADPAKAEAKVSQIYDQRDASRERTWSAKEFPIIHGWIAKNEAHLNRLQQAGNLHRFYSPPLATNKKLGGVVTTSTAAVMPAREVAATFVTRAMLKIDQGNLRQAEDDLIACRLLGRWVSQGETLVDSLVGIALDGFVRTAELVLINSKKLSAEELMAYAARLRALPKLKPAVDNIDFYNRVMLIDMACLVAKDGLTGLDHIAIGEVLSDPQLRRFADNVLNTAVKWDAVLKNGNAWVDRLVAIAKEPDPNKQRRELAKYEDDLTRLSKSVRDFNDVTLRILAKGIPAATTDWISQVLVSEIMPGTGYAVTAERRAHVYNDQMQLALALAAYRAEAGKYPSELALLVPKYLERIPLDVFSGAPFHYAASDEAFQLYSIGQDGVDDYGQSAYVDENAEFGDDIAIRVGKLEEK